MRICGKKKTGDCTRKDRFIRIPTAAQGMFLHSAFRLQYRPARRWRGMNNGTCPGKRVEVERERKYVRSGRLVPRVLFARKATPPSARQNEL
jgi:hypothetical protein